MASEHTSGAKKLKLDHTADAPKELKVVDLVQSHAKEIRALTQAVANVQKNRNTSQAIPHYMRRRAASHNANRLPRSVRMACEKFVPGKRKRPSRHYRRRPNNLKEEYAKRQRRVHWLETHLWHAKRFHMIEKWGYKLPNYPTDKGLRSACRAATKYCLIQDQSYIHCIDVQAPEGLLLDTLASFLPAEQLGEASVVDYSRGVEVIYSVLYKPAQYPEGAICPVEVMFNPQSKGNQRQIWLWCHTTAVKSVWLTLCEAFKVTETSYKDGPKPTTLELADGGFVSLNYLRDELVRLQLNGQRTFNTLARVIHPTDPNPAAEGEHVWWKGEFAHTEGEITPTEDLTTSLKLWYRCNGTVATATTRDPRLCLPKIISTMKAVKTEKETDKYYHSASQQWGADSIYTHLHHKLREESDNDSDNDSGRISPSSLWRREVKEVTPACSALWSEEVRARVSSHRMSQQEVNERRSLLLVPGSEATLGDDENCVPLILVLHNNKAEVILPAKWGMEFWMAFTYAGARPGGVREDRIVSLCTDKLYFPHEFPDTEICQQEDLLEAKALTKQHFKYPTNKRPSFNKLRTNSPFRCDWRGLVSDKVPVVLRNTKLLKTLQTISEAEHNASIRTRSVDQLPTCHANLVAVSVSMLKRGFPQERAEICLPSPSDIAALQEDESSHAPEVESYKGELKERDDTHSTLPSDKLTTGREVVGFVTAGMFSLELGLAHGRGFVTTDYVYTCLRDQDLRQWKSQTGTRYGTRTRYALLCLIRAHDSKQYRFALLNILDPARCIQ